MPVVDRYADPRGPPPLLAARRLNPYSADARRAPGGASSSATR